MSRLKAFGLVWSMLWRVTVAVVELVQYRTSHPRWYASPSTEPTSREGDITSMLIAQVCSNNIQRVTYHTHFKHTTL